MPVSLAQAALNTQDALDAMVIDEFRKSSAILDSLIFDQAVNPMGGGSTLTYGYHRVITGAEAAFRAINAEYVPGQAAKARFTVDLKPLGGSFEIDRVLAKIARGGEVTFQMEQKIKATSTKFQDEVINGDTAVDANGFDGLDKSLTGSDTEIGTDAITDWTDLDTSGFQKALDRFDEFLMLLDGEPTVVVGNRYSIAKLSAIARRANVYQDRPIDGLTGPAGQPITRKAYGNVLLVDAGEKAGSNQLIVPVYDPDNAIYDVVIAGTPTGGDYTLVVDVNGDVEETAAIAFNAGQAAVDSALEALANVGAGNVSVSTTGTTPNFTHAVTFDGDLAGVDVLLRVGQDNLTGGTGSVTVTESATTGGFTDIYAYRVGRDGFHAVATADDSLVNTWLPDFDRAGAVKTGEVEMGPIATVLKATKAAAVLRQVKIR